MYLTECQDKQVSLVEDSSNSIQRAKRNNRYQSCTKKIRFHSILLSSKIIYLSIQSHVHVLNRTFVGSVLEPTYHNPNGKEKLNTTYPKSDNVSEHSRYTLAMCIVTKRNDSHTIHSAKHRCYMKNKVNATHEWTSLVGLFLNAFAALDYTLLPLMNNASHFCFYYWHGSCSRGKG